MEVNDLRLPPQALVALIEPEWSEDKAWLLLHRFPFLRDPSVKNETYATEFLDFFPNFFTISLGLWPMHDAMLQPQSRPRGDRVSWGTARPSRGQPAVGGGPTAAWVGETAPLWYQ